MSKCSIDGCDKEVSARSLCATHYMRERRAGTVPVGTRARGSLEERFWRFVDTSGDCWLWVGGSKSQKGYGMIQIAGQGSPKALAHRLSYRIHHGEIPEGLVVMHSCDNPACVNPAHLKAGTQSENILDAFSKGRKRPVIAPRKGEAHHMAKVTEETVRWIRACGLTINEMAAMLGLAYSTVRRIKCRVSWPHVS